MTSPKYWHLDTEAKVSGGVIYIERKRPLDRRFQNLKVLTACESGKNDQNYSTVEFMVEPGEDVQESDLLSLRVNFLGREFYVGRVQRYVPARAGDVVLAQERVGLVAVIFHGEHGIVVPDDTSVGYIKAPPARKKPELTGKMRLWFHGDASSGLVFSLHRERETEDGERRWEEVPGEDVSRYLTEDPES